MDRPEGGACLHPSATLRAECLGQMAFPLRSRGPFREATLALQPCPSSWSTESMRPGGRVHGAHGLS